jgi:aspartate aminotransferase
METQELSVINFRQGQPTCDVLAPPHLLQNTIGLSVAGYTDNAGLDEARAAVAALYKKLYNINIALDNVIITAGCTTAATAGILTFKGDENNKPLAIFLNPTYHLYERQVKTFGYDVKQTSDFNSLNTKQRIDSIKDILKNNDERNVVLFVNTPSNPTGEVYSKEFIKQLAGLLDKYPNLHIIEDAIYEQLIFAPGVRNHSVFAHANAETRNRVVFASGGSKSFAVPGLRLGWAVATPEVITKMDAYLDTITGQAAIVSQEALIKALADTESLYPGYHLAYCHYLRQQAEQVMKLAPCVPSLHFHEPQGGMYVFVQGNAETINTLHEACAEKNLLFPAPEVFGVPGLRFNIAASSDDVYEALTRFTDVLRENSLLTQEPSFTKVPTLDLAILEQAGEHIGQLLFDLKSALLPGR